MADTTRPAPPVLTCEVAHRVVMRWKGASDNVGIDRYEAWDGSTFLKKLASTTRTFQTPPLSPGPHKLRIVAYDAADNYTNSNQVEVAIPGATSPTEPPTEPPPPGAGQYQFTTLVFEDLFNTLDLSRWLLYDGAGHDGNGLRDPYAWSIQDGVEGASGRALVCTAKWDAAIQKIRSGGMRMRAEGHTSGGFEARVRFEEDPLHVTNALFMTWPDGPGMGGWPVNGENNIWESNSGDRAPMMTFIHYDPDNKQKSFAHPGSDGTKWNVVRMEWTPDAIKIFVNGVLSWTMTDKAAIPTHPHHVTLQLDAMRNADPGREVRAYYDYVRIYK